MSRVPNDFKLFVGASRRQRVRAGVVLAVLGALFVLFGLMAGSVIDPDMWLDPCGFKQKYGYPCPTCGMTHSVLCFARGRVFEAFYVQPAAAFICCVMIIVFFLALLTAVFGIYLRALDSLFSQVRPKHLLLTLVIVIAAAWAVTLSRAMIHESF